MNGNSAKNNKQGRKALIKIFIVLTVLFLVIALITGILALVLSVLQKFSKAGNTTERVFAEPDYEANISEDEEYIALDSRVWISDGTLSAPLDDDVYSDDAVKVFFDAYFTALKKGDAAGLKAMYRTDLVKALGLPYKMPQQRVYDIMLTYLSESGGEDVNGAEYTDQVWRFEYKIKDNDGVFRRDIGSGESRPQIVTLRITGERVIIYDVITRISVKGG